jgi:hypothetical protein
VEINMSSYLSWPGGIAFGAGIEARRATANSRATRWATVST